MTSVSRWLHDVISQGGGQGRDRLETVKEQSVAAKAGEKAEKTGTSHCARCSETVRVKKGDTIPECANGHKTFEMPTDEPGNKS